MCSFFFALNITGNNYLHLFSDIRNPISSPNHNHLQKTSLHQQSRA